MSDARGNWWGCRQLEPNQKETATFLPKGLGASGGASRSGRVSRQPAACSRAGFQKLPSGEEENLSLHKGSKAEQPFSWASQVLGTRGLPRKCHRVPYLPDEERGGDQILSKTKDVSTANRSQARPQTPRRCTYTQTHTHRGNIHPPAGVGSPGLIQRVGLGQTELQSWGPRPVSRPH